MSIVLIVYWKVKMGSENYLENLLPALIKKSLSEKGCLNYSVTRSREDKSVFILLQEFIDIDAARANQLSTHYKWIVEDRIAPILEKSNIHVLDGLSFPQLEYS